METKNNEKEKEEFRRSFNQLITDDIGLRMLFDAMCVMAGGDQDLYYYGLSFTTFVDTETDIAYEKYCGQLKLEIKDFTHNEFVRLMHSEVYDTIMSHIGSIAEKQIYFDEA